MTLIRISAVMENPGSAERLKDHVEGASVAEYVQWTGGMTVNSGSTPENAAATAAAFAGFLIGR